MAREWQRDVDALQAPKSIEELRQLGGSDVYELGPPQSRNFANEFGIYKVS